MQCRNMAESCCGRGHPARILPWYSAGWADKNGEGEIWPGVTMRRGSRGATVKSAQQKLKTLVPELTTDGRYGASTREAVLAWQVVHDLKPDGMLGRATWNNLYGVTTRKA